MSVHIAFRTTTILFAFNKDNMQILLAMKVIVIVIVIFDFFLIDPIDQNLKIEKRLWKRQMEWLVK